MATLSSSPFRSRTKRRPKRRPAVIISSNSYNERELDVIVMAITSQVLRRPGAIGEVLLSDWQGAGLPKASLVKAVLATLEQRLILQKLGTLRETDLQELRLALQQIIG